jgi:polysaccharide biosynthesis protein PslH
VFSEYLFLSKAFLQFSADVRKVLDTIDVFTNRHRLYAQQGQPPVWFSTTRREERKALRRADVVIAIQEHERRFFQQLAPGKSVVTIGHLVELQPLPIRTEAPFTLLFLASANQANVHGFSWFLREVWPTVQQQQPEVRVLVAGSICAAIADHPAVMKIGTFEDAQTICAQADIVISPILFGTGLKIKNIEALGYAKPLVTTTSGAEGLEQGMSTAFFAAATAEEFARRIIELVLSVELRQTLSQHAYRFAGQLQQQNCSTLEHILQDDLTSCQNR